VKLAGGVINWCLSTYTLGLVNRVAVRTHFHQDVVEKSAKVYMIDFVLCILGRALLTDGFL
jgi:hypothetical protein